LIRASIALTSAPLRQDERPLEVPFLADRFFPTARGGATAGPDHERPPLECYRDVTKLASRKGHLEIELGLALRRSTRRHRVRSRPRGVHKLVEEPIDLVDERQRTMSPTPRVRMS
jgi:hypothetical protein